MTLVKAQAGREGGGREGEAVVKRGESSVGGSCGVYV